MDDPRGRQSAFNAASRDQWSAFAGHRARVSALLGVGAAPRPTRLCVLGAGNANDLDLSALLRAHREVHLVDLDPDALVQGVSRQRVADHPALKRFGGVDVTGMLDAVAAWSSRTTLTPPDLAALAGWPSSRVALGLPGPYDVVASTCLLSQLLGGIFLALGKAHPQFPAALAALRRGHLRLLSQLAAPGGEAILITDVVSSDTLPSLSSLSDRELPALLPRLARERNHIHGVHPDAIVSVIRHDPVLKGRVAGCETVAPWRWSLHARSYLVWAVKFQIRTSC